MKKIALSFSLMFVIVVSAQQTSYADFTALNAKVSLDTLSKTVFGDAVYSVFVKKTIDSLAIDAHNMQFGKVMVNSKPTLFMATDKQLVIYFKFKENHDYKISFSYHAKPKQALYFVGWQSKASNQIWTQGQGKYTSHWLPSFDDVNEKFTVDIQISFDERYTVLSNGIQTQNFTNNGIKTSRFELKQPISSYLIALAIGDYQQQTLVSKSGDTIRNYYEAVDAERAIPTYQHTKQIFDFLEEEIGIPYPFETYRQVPVRDFLYAGMENVGLTIFSDDFLVDSIAYKDKNFVEVSAHELAHQWFGNLVTAKSSRHHWLQEGFSTYYALKATRAIFGEDAFHWKLYESALELSVASATGMGEAVLSEKASSLTYYQKGAWALFALEKAVGLDTFNKAVKNYLNKYTFSSAETDDFLREITALSTFDVITFKNNWLENPIFLREEAMEMLKGTVVSAYLQLNCKHDKAACDKILFSDAIAPLKQEVVSQLLSDSLSNKEALVQEILQKGDAEVMQATVRLIDTISESLRPEFEKLLLTESYETIETVLFKLWIQFPEHRHRYLNLTASLYGFKDFNIRQLWLALALTTKDYRDDQKRAYYEELTAYSMPSFSYQIRTISFRYLFDLQLISDVYLNNLLNASVHPVWQFSKGAKDFLREIIKDSDYKAFYLRNFSQFSIAEQTVLDRMIKEAGK
ncbi:MAG: M1 family metallopeptidase [Bacteroidetes bacterium]|nr:M1 family metallopeptidase [Bacteroidota bacterium]